LKIPGHYLHIALLVFLLLPSTAFAGEHAVSLGYGIGILNSGTSIGHVEGGDNYNFTQVTYLYEEPYWKRGSVAIEPFAAYVAKPDAGVDVGFSLLLRWYPFNGNHRGAYVDLGAGTAYTSVAFPRQGTHFLGILAGGLGYKNDAYFVQARFRHYSNGNTAHPNESVNAGIVSVGWFF